MALSFARDIRPLFRDTPVKKHAEAIHARLEDGSMPCDEAWPTAQIAKFKQWMDEGMVP